MTAIRALALAAVGVTFIKSPRYLAEKMADAVDARLLDVRDERRFWRQVMRTYELRQSELPDLQARVARKYCRNLDIWSRLAWLKQDYALYLVYSGPRLILDCWREEYGLEGVFDGIIEAAAAGLVSRDGALYRLVAERVDAAVSACALVDGTADGVAAAESIGMPAYRYGTGYGLLKWLDEAPRRPSLGELAHGPLAATPRLGHQVPRA